MRKAAIDVAAGCIRRGDRFLLCRRPPHMNGAGQWEFPGGKLEPEESAAQALERELMEELRIQVHVSGQIADTDYAYPGFTIHLMLMSAVIERGEPELIEHTALRWVTAVEAQGMELCPADRILLDRIMEDHDGISE